MHSMYHNHHRAWPLLAVGLALGGMLVGPARAVDPFVRGDVDQSSRLDVTDAVSVLRFLFAGERNLVTCDDAADADDSGALDTSDAVYLLSALFRGGPVPVVPFPACGEDATEDTLGCEAYEVCRFAFTFYAQSFAADGVFFVIDRSGSMQDSGELQRAKQEILSFIEAAPPESRFGIVFFDASLVRFPASGTAAEATPEMKDSASAFVNSVPGGSGSCVKSGLLAAVDFARSTGARRNLIIYVGDGGGTCQGADEAAYLAQTLEAVTSANSGKARIHVIGVLDLSTIGGRFLRDLASRNGGTFTMIR
jgi:von Willebrand factor type A domain